jgi:hypothetical protein
MLIRPLWESVTRHLSAVRFLSRLERLSIARYGIAHIGVREVVFTTGC